MVTKEHYIFPKMFPEAWAAFNKKTLTICKVIIAPEGLNSEGEGTEQRSNVLVLLRSR